MELNGCCYIRIFPNKNKNEFIFGNVFQEQYSITFDYNKELITFYGGEPFVIPITYNYTSIIKSIYIFNYYMFNKYNIRYNYV